jgi:hypothetical protein
VNEVVQENLRHILFAFLLLGRLGDLVTTYLVTPTLVLEGNPLVRRGGWRFALITSVVCAAPYFSIHLAIALIVASLLASAGNAGRVWVARTMGERAQFEFMIAMARRGKRAHALLGVLASASFIVLVGLFVFLLYPQTDEWAFWVAAGVVGYGAAIAVHGSFYTVHIFREAAKPGDAQPPPNNALQLTSDAARMDAARS